MKRRLIFVLAAVSMAVSNSVAQSRCTAVVRANVEIANSDLVLSDLLTPDSCAELRSAAAAIRLGSAPLEGSSRVLLGSEVKEHIEAIVSRKRSRIPALRLTNVPDRITVRRAGDRFTCAEIESKFFHSRPVVNSSAAGELTCGAGNGIAVAASIEQAGQKWDPATGSWFVTARCRNPRECVPFTVRASAELASGNARGMAGARLPRSASNALVRPGQPASLLWDQAGIRVVVPSVCLDAGSAGEIIRTRIVRSNQILRAIVVSREELKAVL